MKNVSLQKGLFRIYTVLSLCGIICLAISIYYHVQYNKLVKQYEKRLSSEYGIWLREYKNTQNHPYAYVTRTNILGQIKEVERQVYDEFCMEKYGRIYGKKDYPPPGKNRINDALSRHYEYADGGLMEQIARQNARKSKALYGSLFFYLTVAPWSIHFLFKITLLPLFCWIIKGFRK